MALRVTTSDTSYTDRICAVTRSKGQYEETKLPPDVEMALEELKQSPNLYGRLTASIAPEIRGHEDVKRAFLLLLVGGLTKDIDDGMKIRGDIHVCLMGNPGATKSQLLKYIFKVAPRGVYTTGEGISDVGLMDEMDGATVLEDNGICCIDEFNKMNESDQTVIYEAMKQQTISTSSMTLDMRTSILAAANPLHGWYNPKVSPAENLNLPAALLSHFDLMFLITDEPTRDDDEEVEPEFTTIDPTHYFAKARLKRPAIFASVSEYITRLYAQRRERHERQEGANKAHPFTSVRTLSTLTRLSQALARLRFANTVDIADVEEAARLMKASKDSFEARPGDTMRGDENPTRRIFKLMKGMAARPSRRTMGRSTEGRDMDVDEEDTSVMTHILMTDLRESALAKGFTESQLLDTIQTYESANIISRSVNGQYVWFLHTNKI